MSTLRELRKDMKEREVQQKKSNPRPSPPASEIGSVQFGSYRSDPYSSAVSVNSNEFEETSSNMQESNIMSLKNAAAL